MHSSMGPSDDHIHQELANVYGKLERGMHNSFVFKQARVQNLIDKSNKKPDPESLSKMKQDE